MRRLDPASLFRSQVLAFAPLEPITANPILRELMGRQGAHLVCRPKLLPQHLLKAPQWQRWQKIPHLQHLQTNNQRNFYDGFQLIARLNDPIKAAIILINDHASSMGIDYIDLNFCCPGYKILPLNRGGDLLSHPAEIIEIITKVLKYTSLPISVKIRRGITIHDTPTALCRQIAHEFCSNISWITINRAPVKMGDVISDSLIHDYQPFVQAYEGTEGIIPIIANGGITNVEMVRSLFQLPIKGIMIGRGALGNHTFFSLSETQPEIRTLFNDFFTLIHQYHQSKWNRWCNLGYLKQQIYYYIKAYYLHKQQQLPSHTGFASWNRTKFSISDFIHKMYEILPQISLDQWHDWLYYLSSEYDQQAFKETIAK